MEDLRITLTNALKREEIIDDLLEMICANSDVSSIECHFCDQMWTAKLGMVANADVFAVLLALSYPEITARL